jgi:transposase
VGVHGWGSRGRGDDVAGAGEAGLDAKKKTVAAAERDEEGRAEWRERVAGVDPSRLRFVDEAGSNLGMARTRARSPRGERAYASAPRNRGPNTTIIASIAATGELDAAAMTIERATDSLVFEAYTEWVLCPTLKSGEIVVMDNLGAHKRPRIHELIEARGCDVWYLPAYSPDLNPIEEAFSKLKTHLRRAAARTQEALLTAIAEALRSITASDAAGYFTHCGYPTSPQPL